uniref:Uncharacterized protein n=1 Tax=Aegilops tauschii subsp. strangulata TaxID=200361 RepID=A0A453MDD8_AEGTS
ESPGILDPSAATVLDPRSLTLLFSCLLGEHSGRGGARRRACEALISQRTCGCRGHRQREQGVSSPRRIRTGAAQGCRACCG